jgi:hypothetical protein
LFISFVPKGLALHKVVSELKYRSWAVKERAGMREGRWDYIKYSLKKELGWGKREAYTRETTRRKNG